MNINYDINNSNTIILVNSEREKEKVVEALYDMGLSYLTDDVSFRDRVIVRESFTQEDLDDLSAYLDFDFDDCESDSLFSNVCEFIGEKFNFDKASYHGMLLSQFA